MNTLIRNIIIYLILAAVPIGYAFWHVQGYKGEIKTKTEDIDLKDKKIKEMDAEIDGIRQLVAGRDSEIKLLQEQLKDIKLAQETAEKIQASQTKMTEAEKLIDESVQGINRKYASIEKSDASERARKRDISRERVKGLWLSYCIAYPDNQRCKD